MNTIKKVLWGPHRVDMVDGRPEIVNGKHMYVEGYGFMDVAPSGPLRDQNDWPLHPVVRVTFHDLHPDHPDEPPVIVDLEDYLCLQAWLRFFNARPIGCNIYG